MPANKIFVSWVSLLLIVLSSCGNSESNNEEEQEEQQTPVQEENLDLVSTIQRSAALSRFYMELGAAEIPDFENEQGNYTFFAPMNGAFTPFYDEANNRVITITSEDLISYHMVPGEYSIDQLEEQLENSGDSLSLSTVQGEQIWITREDDEIVLRGKFGGEAEILETLNASNGIVHIIDQVLLPAEIKEQNPNGGE